jgi:hypothetical protein
MTSRSAWKRREREAAGLFGTARTPLSGGNGRITRSDSLHPDLFVETKLREHHAVYSLFREVEKLAAVEHKTAVVVLAEKHKPGLLIVCRPESIHELHHLLKTCDTLPEVDE